MAFHQTAGYPHVLPKYLELNPVPKGDPSLYKQSSSSTFPFLSDPVPAFSASRFHNRGPSFTDFQSLHLASLVKPNLQMAPLPALLHIATTPWWALLLPSPILLLYTPSFGMGVLHFGLHPIRLSWSQMAPPHGCSSDWLTRGDLDMAVPQSFSRGLQCSACPLSLLTRASLWPFKKQLNTAFLPGSPRVVAPLPLKLCRETRCFPQVKMSKFLEGKIVFFVSVYPYHRAWPRAAV